jgi:uncharacterized membrane protein
MDTGKHKPHSRRERYTRAGLSGALLGALVGAMIGASFQVDNSALIGAFVGAIVLGTTEAITDALRKPGYTKPQVYRIITSALVGAAIGALLDIVLGGLDPLILGLVMGTLSGALSLRWQGFALGVITGLVIGYIAASFISNTNAAILSGLVILVYRSISALTFKGQESIRFSAERVHISDLRYVVPFEANSKYVGADYFKELARAEDGSFKRNQPGAGIVETMDSMRGPYFDPELVDPLIREFYEHTSRFKLDIQPVWKKRYKPLFWLFKNTVAQPMGQANLPFNTEEAQRGIVSYIDTIDFRCDDIIDLRGWVRAFKETGEAIYVGIYTTFRYDGVGYVSVGFPLPASNFTATLLPHNLNGSNFILKSHDTGYSYPGHYLTTNEDGKLTVLELPTLLSRLKSTLNAASYRLTTDSTWLV